MAVVALDAGRSDRMMSVVLDVFADLVMTLPAGLVALSTVGDLAGWIALVHRMARQAGKFSLDVTGRLEQSQELSTPDTNGAIGPEGTAGVILVPVHVAEGRCLFRFRSRFVRTKHSHEVLEFASGSIRRTVGKKALEVRPSGPVGYVKRAVTLSADFR